MDIPCSVGTSVLRRQEVLHRIVLGDLGCKGHHLPRGGVGAHIGITEIHIILLDAHDAIHRLL